MLYLALLMLNYITAMWNVYGADDIVLAQFKNNNNYAHQIGLKPEHYLGRLDLSDMDELLYNDLLTDIPAIKDMADFAICCADIPVYISAIEAKHAQLKAKYPGYNNASFTILLSYLSTCQAKGLHLIGSAD